MMDSPADARVLVVEDEALFARAVARRLGRDGAVVDVAGTLALARDALAAQRPDVVLLDMRLPDGSGMSLLEDIAALGEPPPVLVMTAFAGLEDAVAAMRAGAADYVTKPLDLDALSARVATLLADGGRAPGAEAKPASRRGSRNAAEQPPMVGSSAAMQQLREEIARLGALVEGEDWPPTMLLLGETGTGKDVAARALHAASGRAGAPFVHVDCAALPKGVIEAELFGHARGAFTGAHGARAGLVEAAGQGTVFLDEVGELPLDVQSRLLAVLERRRLRRVGATDETRVPAWFIAATNRDLDAMVATGDFRADLYYRLEVMPLRLPPLRDRNGDVVELASHFLAERARQRGVESPTLGTDAIAALRAHRWPGNVRELLNVIERAVLRAAGAGDAAATVTAGHLGLATSRPADAAAAPPPVLDDTLPGAERALIEQALAASDGNVSAAARQLGVSRMTLRYRIDKYGILRRA